MVRPVPRSPDVKQDPLTFVLLAATAFAIYLCYQMAVPFLSATVWALTLAILFSPLQGWLERKWKKTGLAALASVLLIAFVVLMAMSFLGQRLILEAAKGAGVIQVKVQSGEWRQALEALPGWNKLVDQIDQRVDLPGLISSLATWLSGMAGSIVQASFVQTLGLVLTFYLLFFFLRDRRGALQGLNALSPLTRDEMTRLTARIGDTVHATVYGTLAVSSLQGLLGGLMFWWLGFSAALLWGVVMAVLALIPMLGAFVVWVPAALGLLLMGSWGKALILALWGMLVVGTVDNLLRPFLVGGRLKLHTVLAFMSVVGGLIMFGSPGLILGPVILAITVVLLEICRERFSAESPAANAPLAQAERAASLLGRSDAGMK